ncbi:helix-turn-helix domain-containing protein [Achromobacter arsenitoxydans]|uniref:XRE family transcriptional regulator n=1 Tax=Achromobacter arsenitoxydans SY8 TaxID=477184 RepID=H0F6Q9_9BURK|nr:helix-turn-helix transcriptional regulator [Achromobacter arsenitoxydans]EHK65967.1 XRE family transcriptional regulator [Achromobacter arsenitoxydans SY8]
MTENTHTSPAFSGTMMTLGYHDLGQNGAFSEGLLIVAHHVRLPRESVKAHFGKGRPIGSIVKDREADPARRAALQRARKHLSSVAADSPEAMSALTRLRLSKGLSQSELADICETQQSYIAKIEKSKVDLRAGTIRRLATALGVSCDEIIEATGKSDE